MRTSEERELGCITQECFHGYVSAEIKIPNTLIAVGPYVGYVALKSFSDATDLRAAVHEFASTYKFSRSQIDDVIKAIIAVHGKFGVPVLPEGADAAKKEGVRIFKQERFEVVYMEGVMNILESISVLHGVQKQKDRSPKTREAQVAEILENPDKLATMISVFAAARDAINSPEATEKSEAFREIFNFTKTGEKPRPMRPEEKHAIQTETMPFIIAAVTQVLHDRKMDISDEQVEKFVYVLTSPELYVFP